MGSWSGSGSGSVGIVRVRSSSAAPAQAGDRPICCVVCGVGSWPRGEDVADSFHRPAVRRVLGHRRLEHWCEPAGVGQARWVLVDDLVEGAERVVGDLVRRTAGQCVKQGRAERPRVTGVGRLAARSDLRGRGRTGKPVTSPVWVSEASATARAMPKSVSFTWSAAVTRMLAGFTSRCTIPAACAAASAWAA